MNKLNWIETAGGCLILATMKQAKLWSGIFNRLEFLNHNLVEADNFMEAEEADYGKACLVDDYLGLVEIANENTLVLGEQPLSTTFFIDANNQKALVRWEYAEDESFVNEHLQKLDLFVITHWQKPLFFKVISNTQYLFDSARIFTELQKENEDYLELNIEKGNYMIWTSIYEPNNQTRLIIHKFEKIKCLNNNLV